MKPREINPLTKFCELLKKLLKASRVPKYFSKFSNKVFSVWEKITLLVLRQKLRMSYREFSEFIEFAGLHEKLGLKRTPHYTTLQKFHSRIGNIFDIMLLHTHKVVNLSLKLVGMDSSGFNLNNPSHYYCHRIDNVKVKGFIKAGLISDLDKQLVIGQVITDKQFNDASTFKPLLAQALNQGSVKIVTADKGYDSESNHEYAHAHGIQSIIPIRRKARRIKGFYRKQMNKNFQKKIYNKRAITETIFSVIKRTLRSNLTSRQTKNQINELKTRIIAYNMQRIVKIMEDVKGFLQDRLYRNV